MSIFFLAFVIKWHLGPGVFGEELHQLAQSNGAGSMDRDMGKCQGDLGGRWSDGQGWMMILPSGNLLRSYWKWPFIVDFPMKNGGSFHSYVKLPEGRSKFSAHILLFHFCFSSLGSSWFFKRVLQVCWFSPCDPGGVMVNWDESIVPFGNGVASACLMWFSSMFLISCYRKNYSRFIPSITHRIHGAGIYAYMTGVYWWDQCYH